MYIYDLICSDSREKFLLILNARVKEGWRVEGNLAIDTTNSGNRFNQLIKKKEEE